MLADGIQYQVAIAPADRLQVPIRVPRELDLVSGFHEDRLNWPLELVNEF